VRDAGHAGGRGTRKDGAVPFVSPLSLAVHEAQLVALVGERATVGMVTSEPPPRCYVTDSCGTTPRR
jgi:hypothetical protein